MPNDLAVLVPEALAICFHAAANGQITTEETVITVTLASLNLPEYQNIVGAPYTRPLHRYELAQWSGLVGSSVFLNQAVLTALARQWATDWYHWQLAAYDIQLTGCCPWTPDGLGDIEIRQGSGGSITRIIRGPFNPQEDLLTPAPLVINNSLVITNVYITNVYSVINFYNIVNFYSVVNFYETIIIIDGVVWGNPVATPLVTNVCLYTFSDELVYGSTTALTPDPLDLMDIGFTLKQPSEVIAIACVEWDVGGGGGGADAWLVVDGSTQAQTIPVLMPVGPAILMGTQTWLLNLGAGDHRIQLFANLISGGVSIGPNTTLLVDADDTLVVEKATFFLPNGTQFGGKYCVVNPQDCCVYSTSFPACCDPNFPIAPQWVINFSLVGCGGGGGPDCSNCASGAPRAWSFTGTGFGTSACAGFGIFNGLWILDPFTLLQLGCRWRATQGDFAAEVSVGPGGNIRLFLTAAAGAEAVYAATISPADCCSPITLTLLSNTGVDVSCLQNSITITPIGCASQGRNISGPITVNQITDCCWEGSSDTDPDISALWCIFKSPDGVYYWSLIILDKGVAIASYIKPIGFNKPNCCLPVFPIPLQSTNCEDGDYAQAIPLGCGGSSSGGGPPGVVKSCCPGQPIPFVLVMRTQTLPPHLPLPTSCDPCFGVLRIDLTFIAGYIPSPSNHSGDAWVGFFDCYGGGTLVILQCLDSGIWVLRMTGQCNHSDAVPTETCGPPLLLTFFGGSAWTLDCCTDNAVEIQISET
jgi:hypothetical protein